MSYRLWGPHVDASNMNISGWPGVEGLKMFPPPKTGPDDQASDRRNLIGAWNVVVHGIGAQRGQTAAEFNSDMQFFSDHNVKVFAHFHYSNAVKYLKDPNGDKWDPNNWDYIGDDGTCYDPSKYQAFVNNTASSGIDLGYWYDEGTIIGVYQLDDIRSHWGNGNRGWNIPYVGYDANTAGNYGLAGYELDGVDPSFDSDTFFGTGWGISPDNLDLTAQFIHDIPGWENIPCYHRASAMGLPPKEGGYQHVAGGWNLFAYSVRSHENQYQHMAPRYSSKQYHSLRWYVEWNMKASDVHKAHGAAHFNRSDMLWEIAMVHGGRWNNGAWSVEPKPPEVTRGGWDDVDGIAIGLGATTHNLPLYSPGTVSTSLNGAVNDSVTAWTVNDGSTYPSLPFLATCESEVVRVTAMSGTNNVNWTVERGHDRTTAASHADSTTVDLDRSDRPRGYPEVEDWVGGGTQGDMFVRPSELDEVVALVEGLEQDYGPADQGHRLLYFPSYETDYFNDLGAYLKRDFPSTWETKLADFYAAMKRASDLYVSGDVPVQSQSWQTVVGKYSYSTDQASYRAILTYYDMRLSFSSTGDPSTNAIHIADGGARTLTNGTPAWYRFTANPATGVAKIYTSVDGAAWTQVGADHSFTPNTSIHDGTGPLEIGRTGEDSNYWDGKIYYVEVRDGINGPIVTKMDFRTEDQATWSSGSSWADGYGHTWTATGSPVYVPAETTEDPPPFTVTLDTPSYPTVLVPPNFYGPGRGYDANVNFNLDSGSRIGRARFRAPITGDLEKVNFYAKYNGSAEQTGYSDGDGGKIRVDIYADDGSEDHLPTGSSLANATYDLSAISQPLYSNPNHPETYFPLLTLSASVSMTEGEYYHAEFTNTAADPTNDYASINNSLDFATGGYTYRPTISFDQWAWFESSNGGTDWTRRDSHDPMLELHFDSDTFSYGNGYLDPQKDDSTRIDGTTRLSQLFTVSDGTREVTGVSFKINWRSGGSPPADVVVSVLDGNETLLREVSVDASGLVQGDYNDGRWLNALLFPSLTLLNGEQYRLVIETSAGTSFQMVPQRDGVKAGNYEWTTRSVFSDGNAQIDSGGGWSDWDVWSSEDVDLPFFFQVAPLDSVVIAWTGTTTTVNIDERVNGGAWTRVVTGGTSPQTVGPYVAGDFIEYRLALVSNPLVYSTNFITIPTVIANTTRINAGGALIASGTGDWDDDLTEASSGTGWSNDSTGTNVYNPPTNDVTGIPPEISAEVFGSERYGPATYTFTGLTNGNNYRLRIIMAEQWFGGTAAGQRVFSIEVNGVLTHANVDPIAATGGPDIAYLLHSIHQPIATEITVGFLTGPANFPLVNALELVDLGPDTPPTTPAAATGFTATATSASTIDLAWTDNATNEGYYRIERSPDDSTWSLIASLAPDTESYTDSPLTPNTLYYYRVRPELAGATPPSWATANATTDPATTNTGVPIPAGTDPMSIINQYDPGTEFVFGPGIHRGASIQARAGDTYQGSVDGQGTSTSILNGAVVVTGWVQDGSFWRKDGMTQAEHVSGEDENYVLYPRAAWDHELFYDSQRLHHVGSLDGLNGAPPTSNAAEPTHSWFFDYASNSIYTNAPNPNSHTMELADTKYAITGAVADVTINDLIIEKYRNPAQTGAIDPTGTNTVIDGWTINRCIVRHCHGTGIKIRGNNWSVLNSRSHNNGQMGIGSGQDGWADNLVVFNFESDHNNVAGYRAGWEAGGSKFVRTKNASITYSKFHHNLGPGLWTDIDNLYADIGYNEVYGNAEIGIFHEISFNADIHHNNVYNNGFWRPKDDGSGETAPRGWGWEAGIVVAASPDVNVHNNYVHDNYGGITIIQQCRPMMSDGRLNVGTGVCASDNTDTSIFSGLTARTDARQCKDVTIHHNDVTWLGGGHGYFYNQVDDIDDIQNFYSGGSWGNSFENNDYTGNTTLGKFKDYDGTTSLSGKQDDFAWWQAQGNDTSNDGVQDGDPTPGIPGNFTAQALSHDTIRLSWEPGTDATQYRLEYKEFGFAGGFGLVVTTTESPHDHTGLDPETTYYYRLRSEN
jgi:hypothetical protein